MINIQALLQQGYKDLNACHYQQAKELGEKVLSKKYNIDALILVGIAYFKLEQHQLAADYLKKAFNERPNNEVVAIHLLESYLNTDDTDEALKCIQRMPHKSQAVTALQIQFLERKGDFRQAIIQAKLLKNTNKNAIMAWNYERLNELKAAKKAAKKGLIKEVKNYKCLMVLAKIYIRDKRIKKALKQLKKIQHKKLSATNLSIYYSIKAQCFEKQGRYKKAFKTYDKSNQTLKQTQAYNNLRGHSFYTFEKITAIKQYFLQNPQFDIMLKCEQPITFMLGFPRSGTTLLENILNTHTQISSIEEKPTLDEILSPFLQEVQHLKNLNELTSAQIQALQQKYLRSRSQYCDASTPIIIDKMPLNIIHIGILYRLFPNAKFILSTRDIRDVALSCFFQSFALNDAMAYFLDWHTTQDYLKQLMDLGLSIINKYNIDVITIEYEKFVEQPFEEVKNIIKFLDLDWQESIKDYRKQIKGKNINTPSYARISEKIDSKQKQKWKKYRQCF